MANRTNAPGLGTARQRRRRPGRVPLAAALLVTLLGVACRPSLAPHVEEGTIAVGVIHQQELHAARAAHTRFAFGTPPPRLQIRVEETQLGSFGRFSLDLTQEGGVEGTVVLGERVLDIVEASPLEKEGKASTMVLTLAEQNVASRVVPAELVAVGWPDRGRWYRRFGKPLERAGSRDRLADVSALKAAFRAAMDRELAAAELTETPTGFTLAHRGRQTTVDLQRMVDVTTQGQARAVVGRLAALARYKLDRPPPAEGEGRPLVSGNAGAVLCVLGPEGPFSILSRADRESIVTDAAAPGIVGVYIVDYPDHFELLSRADFATLGVERASLARLAARNLYETSGPIYRIDVGNGVYLVSSVGFFDASLLLVPEVWAQIDPVLAGERVVAVPDRDTLLVTGANNSKGMEVLLAAARAAGGAENPVAAHLLVWRSDHYERSRAR